MKKRIAMLLAIVMLVSLFFASCGDNSTPNTSYPSDSSENTPPDDFSADKVEITTPVTIRIATANGESDVKTVIAYKMEEILEDRSNGMIAVEVYPSAQLLSDTGMVEGVPNGATDIGICGLGWWSGLVPEVSVIGGMGIYDSEEHFRRCMESEGGIFEYLAGLFETNAQTKVLTFLYCGASECLITRNKQITSPDDMKGLKYRVPNNSMGAAISALGASPVTIPVGDVYTSLQTGVVDGTIGTLGNSDSNNFWDVVNYVSDLKLAYSDAFGIIVSDAVYNSWEPAVQQLVAEVSEDMYEFSYEYINKTYGEIWAKLEARDDIDVYYISAEDTVAFAELTAPGSLAGLLESCGEDSYNHMVDIIESNK